jgi:hypothetical protein
LSALISGCTIFLGGRAHSSLTVPLYVFRPEAGGILRKQSGELIQFNDPRLKEFLAIRYTSWREVIEYCKVPESMLAN